MEIRLCDYCNKEMEVDSCDGNPCTCHDLLSFCSNECANDYIHEHPELFELEH
jgi:hypothetical protein